MRAQALKVAAAVLAGMALGFVPALDAAKAQSTGGGFTPGGSPGAGRSRGSGAIGIVPFVVLGAIKAASENSGRPATRKRKDGKIKARTPSKPPKKERPSRTAGSTSDRRPAGKPPKRTPKPTIVIETPRRPAAPPPAIVARPPVLPPVPGATAGPPPPQASQAAAALPEHVPDEVLIAVSTTALPEVEDTLARSFNVRVLERTELPLIDARLVRLGIPDARSVPAVVALLSADPDVTHAQPNYYYRTKGDPQPPLTPTSAAAHSPAGLQYALARLSADEVHRIALGRGTRIGVIDSGIDVSHPDLSGARISEYDATAEGSPGERDDSHGTGIAGILTARGVVRGLAPAAELVSARVFRKGANGQISTTAEILKGVTWTVAQKARVLNMSFAGPRDPLVERHVKAVTARGGVIIAAAGNNGHDAAPAYPAAYDGVIAVTAVDAEGRLYAKANHGDYVTVAAPGVDVIVPGAGRSHNFESGTSFAAAHVSGVVALLLEVRPDLTPQSARALIISSADDLGPAGVDSAFGAGHLNAQKAMSLANGVAQRP